MSKRWFVSQREDAKYQIIEIVMAVALQPKKVSSLPPKSYMGDRSRDGWTLVETDGS
jgi:hypothetical protein